MKIIYVLKNVGRAGGHKVVMEHLNGLAKRGHDCELVYLQADPDWFGKILFKKTQLNSIEKIINYLKGINCIKVATWWETAQWVFEGEGQFYLVQDIETSYSNNIEYKKKVLNSYQLGLIHIAENNFQYAALKYALNTNVKRIGIGINHEIFKPLLDIKKEKFILYFYRGGHLKNSKMLEEVIDLIKIDLPEFKLYTYGAANCSFSDQEFLNVSDKQLVVLMNKASILISTSIHEGFCLPLLEAMSCGTPVISTRAIGNETFCINEVNCLLVNSKEELIEGIFDILSQSYFANFLIENGKRTAENYKWDNVIDELENIYKGGKDGMANNSRM